MNDYLERFSAGDALAASRLMSIVERGGGDALAVMDALFPRAGNAYRAGMTGGTGAGKSTLIDALTTRCRRRNQTVGVVAEDPSSPFTGGAVLGDRVRMIGASGDDGVFIRSIASRGSRSGFSSLAGELVDVLDAFGRDVVFLETTGVGQLEVGIRFDVDTALVVFTPESGDEVQSLKSGLIEIADIIVVNKADRNGAAAFGRDLEAAVSLASHGEGWTPPVVCTSASDDASIDELDARIADHHRFLSADGRLERRRREGLRRRTRELASRKLEDNLWGKSTMATAFDGIFEEVASRRLTPQRAADRILDTYYAAGPS